MGDHLMIDFVSHMVDEILVERKSGGWLEERIVSLYPADATPTNQWKITSYPHHDAMAIIKTGDDMQEVLFSDEDLRAFKNLGYAVCHNRLDSYGKKVYIHHNTRTFKQTKNK